MYEVAITCDENVDECTSLHFQRVLENRQVA